MKSNPYSVRITALKGHTSLQLLTPLNQLHIRYSCVHSETPLSCSRYHHCNLVILTVHIIYFTRYDHRVYGIDGVRWNKGLPVSAMVSSVVTDPGPVLLAVMDTFRFMKNTRYFFSCAS